MDALYQNMVKTTKEGDPPFDPFKEVEKRRNEKAAGEKAKEQEKTTSKLKGSTRG